MFPLTQGSPAQWVEEVLAVAEKCERPSVQLGEWVPQKYMQCLLLILGTKFDLQQ